MKRPIITILLAVVTSVALARPIISFTSWNNLIEQSSDIFIAKREDQPFTKGTVTDGEVPYPGEILYVLKGKAEPCLAEIWLADYPSDWPHPNDMFLVFSSNHGTNGTNKWYKAVEDYRVVSIGQAEWIRAWTNALAGKPLKEQIRVIVKNRLSALNGELERGKEEQKRLGDGLKELEK